MGAVDVGTTSSSGEGGGRPVPRPSALTRPFWDACRVGRLTVQRCTRCQGYVFVPQEFCRHCRSTTLTWVETAGTGRIVTYTVVWRPQTPAFTAPYVVAVVELDEGYQMISNIVGSDAAGAAVGDRVRVRFVRVSEAVTLPCFELAA
ncbi:MAG: hypothetical protein ABT15_01190 [Pseudonocardia sp. SCN 73-27]|nr:MULTISPECIES: OB-fold domain-containing protein [unclassified Pseudonocardia]ODU27370.1 MAG: hypothetical protein ABS80_03800 [Pseudonocardia sp. SCN 72-51]ODV09014.1 MAG: hypothetical protein ABT15_01190 [Pseudonocardia sp. SCN 73-27]